MSLAAARKHAAALDRKLLATDKRLNGGVLLVHGDGTVLAFQRAFALCWGPDNECAVILTEHHGWHVYALCDLTYLKSGRKVLRVG